MNHVEFYWKYIFGKCVQHTKECPPSSYLLTFEHAY